MTEPITPVYIVPDSDDPKEHFKEHGFYVSGVKYYVFDIRITKAGTQYNRVMISNFTMKSLYHLVNGTNDSKRIFQLQRNTGEIYLVEIASSEMKPEAFETILKSKQCSFLGNAYNLKMIFIYCMDNETQANIIDALGWNREHHVYAFSNSVFNSKSELIRVNEVGIVTDPETKKNFYLPAFGLAHLNNPDYEGDRKFVFIEGDLDFKQWAEYYYQAFGNNGAIAVLFLILSVFWDIVFEQKGFFPFLFLFGAFGTGKTSLVEYLLRLFGKDYIGFPLNNATQVALSRIIASRNNSIFYLKEYTRDTDEANQDLFLTAYDGAGRATGIKSNDNRTKVALVRSAIILDGNELPTQKTAVLSRMILLNFESNQFTDAQKKAFAELEKRQENGFGNVLIEIFKQRDHFKKNFQKTFDENLSELREVIEADFAERTMKHVALLLTPAKMLIEKLQFPWSFNEVTRAVVDNAIEQNRLLKQTDEVVIFWTAFAWGVKSGSLIAFHHDEAGSNLKSAHYNVKYEKSGENILQIKLAMILPEYVKYCKNNGQRNLDSNSLRMLLTSKSNPDFIPTNQKGKGVYHKDIYFQNCYQFRLKNDEGIYLINGIELNL
jgi:hypothetical protein